MLCQAAVVSLGIGLGREQHVLISWLARTPSHLLLHLFYIAPKKGKVVHPQKEVPTIKLRASAWSNAAWASSGRLSASKNLSEVALGDDRVLVQAKRLLRFCHSFLILSKSDEISTEIAVGKGVTRVALNPQLIELWVSFSSSPVANA